MGLINDRWTRISETDIYNQLVTLGLFNWEATKFCNRDYLACETEADHYSYPYSLPDDVINQLATRLNGDPKMWYGEYNRKAIDHFNETGQALNQALEYWQDHGKPFGLPKPEIMPIDGLKPNDEYFAIIGLFHLTGDENGDNHHLYFDAVDKNGSRIFGTKFRVEWDGISPTEISRLSPVIIDKPLNEPGADFGMTSRQVLNGFYIDNIPVDRFRGVHTQYGDDEIGNTLFHHSHYIVLEKRVYQPGGYPTPIPDPTPAPDPTPDPDPTPNTKIVGTLRLNKAYLDTLTPNNLGQVEINLTVIDD